MRTCSNFIEGRPLGLSNLHKQLKEDIKTWEMEGRTFEGADAIVNKYAQLPNTRSIRRIKNELHTYSIIPDIMEHFLDNMDMEKAANYLSYCNYSASI